jgi:hypothetical protein
VWGDTTRRPPAGLRPCTPGDASWAVASSGKRPFRPLEPGQPALHWRAMTADPYSETTLTFRGSPAFS